jgi:hypothetical protein
VFVLYSAADTKNLNGRDRKKAAEGEHAWTSDLQSHGSTALYVDPESACKAGRKAKPSVSSPGPAALLCCRKFQIVCTCFAHLVHETKLTSLVVALDEKSFFNRRGLLQTNLARASAGVFVSATLAAHQKISRRTKN